jgi:cytochrome P450
MDMLACPDLRSDAFFNDRYAAYRLLRDRFPFFHTEIGGEPCIVVTRHADVDQILRHPLVTVQPEPGRFPTRIGNGPAARHYRESLPSLDDPDHTRLRRIITPALMPKAVAKLRARTEAIIDRYLDRLSEESQVNFVTAFASPLANDLASILLHLSPEETAQLLTRSHALIGILGVTSMAEGVLEAADEAGRFCQAYVDDILDSVSRLPLDEDDFVGVMLASKGKEGGMTRSEIVTTMIGFAVAAYHTTMAQISNTTLALLQHPEQKARLIADPALARSAWEEGLRFDGPVHFMHRYASQPIMIGDVRLEPGIRLVLGLQAGNRDERRFSDPDRFVIDRDDNRHLGFAVGPHFCVGAQLARMEGELIFQRLFQRFPKMALDGAQLAPVRDLSFPLLHSLTVTLR